MPTLKTQAEVDNYLNDWKANINAAIAERDPERSIESYPAINDTFRRMKAAWNASFSDQQNLDKILARDRAILELGKVIALNLK